MADPTTGPTADPATDPAAALYRTVALVRGFEQRAVELVRAKVVPGGIHPYTGQEAIAAGTCAALRPDDVITSTHRGHGHVLAKGADPARTMAELAGRTTGLNRGRGGSMHAADFGVGVLGANAIVGAAVPIAAGAAWAFRRAGSDRVALSYFGDGAVSQGVVLEAFNLAALWRVPLVLVCENNGFATSMRTADTVAGSILGRAAAFGIPARTVDGTDPEAVRDATAEAVARARAGGGPTLLECTAYRFDAHHTWEHTARPRYRTDEEVAAGRARDPLEIQGARIPAATRAAIDAQVAELLDRAVRFACEGPHPDPATALDHLYATGMRARAGVR
ncbi:acetoin:2,6-dichlorophenolindophenol oxidoreductase subunit alpha [Kitasatospora herbaricolor]|uniref:thiamine pyrophosphate-dependent dehydrogenase E1 component subunit alpha n=1 Tax=Kitasatospora herbaricolor TaxID=68217 RepID=UPI00174D745A|nr:thiamine pyrophosphate-dependent dehydrogenase E1 component subunit alpha [Kitasatospora herbaricolor]MDQ0306096.1 pyruvate dehydrogenase E1 component alpha subunit [Kitasatospora herbaricolor]GGV23358.1 acetoin:2,6-dichlorophenolindophenol oxidoreductase subunit alpha [Kitasatospora herbaricolor]